MVTRVAFRRDIPLSPRRSRALTLWLALLVALGASLRVDAQQAPLRKIGELDLAIRGLSATTDASQTLPKNVASAVRVTLRASAQELTGADAERFLGGSFTIAGELSGPGLSAAQTLSIASGSAASPAGGFLLPIPALQTAGTYTLANLRIMRGTSTVLDVQPRTVTLNVLDQILITSVSTRQLTLDEIKQRGIVLDSDSYLGFEFTIGMKLESKAVTISFPAIFDRQNVAIPQSLVPPTVSRTDVPVPTFVPVLLQAEPTGSGGGDDKRPALTTEDGRPITIPSVIVIPGNVGYLKQFFSAQLFVANGAPAGTPLTVHDITGTITLPKGPDDEIGTIDDPLTLAQTETGVHAMLPVRGAGADGLPGTPDDVDVLHPGEQGQAEFLVVGEKEGFHKLDFDIRAQLDGLPIGPVTVRGAASGGVLVRNQYFDMTFTTPAVVRADEPFSVFVTVTNIGQAIGNDITIALDSAALSGMRPDGDVTQHIDTLRAGDAATVEFKFRSQRTGQVVATYLKFDQGAAASGQLMFKAAVTDRGVPLSPDTLVLPSVVNTLPDDVVRAAMRVLGQAYSAANAPAGTLPASVTRPGKDVVTQKALALAEAGLRVKLGQPLDRALRDLAADFYLGTPSTSTSTGTGALPASRFDTGFDQVLRETDAGWALARAFGAALVQTMNGDGGAMPFERSLAQVQASGPDFVSFIVDASSAVDVSITDAASHTSTVGRTDDRPALAAPGVGLLPMGASAEAPILGLMTALTSSPYTLTLTGRAIGTAALSVTLPRGDGTFLRGALSGVAVSPAWRGRVTLDLAQPDRLTLDADANGDGTFELHQPLMTEVLYPQGARLLSANVIGPETIDGASPWGFHGVLVFDRMVDAASAATVAHYQIPSNSVRAAKAVMSQRIVMMTLDQPEGPYVPTTLTANGIGDGRGIAGPNVSVPLASRLADDGAVVTGHVFNADGTPVLTGTIVYTQNPDIVLCNPSSFIGFSSTPLDSTGRYELRYVRQDNCGFAFDLVTTDPATGAVSHVVRSVRTPGERIVADFVMFGRGRVTGIVRDLQGRPVPGANVAVASTNDHQIGGTAITDGDGRYTIDSITVGGISVSASKGTSAGYAAGRIDRAGTTAQIDVTLDGGTVRISGTISRFSHGTLTPAVRAIVHYDVSGVTAGVTTTDANGHYVLEGLPTGAFALQAQLDTYTFGQVTGTASANQNLLRDITVTVPETGAIHGTVRLPSGAPVSGVLVATDGRGVLSAADGTFTLSDIPLGTKSVVAMTSDDRRHGASSVTLTLAGQTVETTVVLSGLGKATFTVLDAAGRPLPNVIVRRLDCNDPCGCAGQTTDGAGRVTFDNVAVGPFGVRAFQTGSSATDAAEGTASVTREGEEAQGIVRFNGFGIVTGLVLDEDGHPVFGADIELSSLHFLNDGIQYCGLVPGVSHHVRTDQQGRFRLPGVNIGGVELVASQEFRPTRVGAQGTLTHDGDQADFTLHLVDTMSGVLSGKVVLPDGVTPAGGVEVTANGQLPDVTVTTNDAGQFHFAKIFPEGRYSLTARDPLTGGTSRDEVYLHAGQDAQHDLRLKGRGTVRVTVVDAANQPVTDAYVRLTETDYPSNTYERELSAANNSVAVFERVFEGPVSVQVSDVYARGGRVSATVPSDGAVVDVTVRLSVVGQITGHVVMPDRTTPIPFATVKLYVAGRVIGQMTTDGNADVGAFAFDYVPAGPFRLDAIDPATARTGVAFGTIDTEGQVVTIDIVSQALGTVQGTVTSNGQPQAGALVTVQSGQFLVKTMTDGAGQYLVRGVPEGSVQVTAALDTAGFLTGTATGALTGEGTTLTLDVALRSSGSVTGQVQTWNGGTAPPALVTIDIGGTGGGRQQAVTQADGTFVFERVAAGTATLSASLLDGIDQGRTTAEVPAGGAVNVPLRLNGVGRLRVRALDSSGTPVTGGTIRVSGTNPVFPYSQTVTSGADGIAVLPQLLAGGATIRLEVRNGAISLFGSATATVVADDEQTVDVQLQPTGTLIGRVLRADGATPANGAEVSVYLPSLYLRVATTADQDGNFELRGLPLVTMSLSVKDAITGGLALVPSLTLTTNGQTLDAGTIILDDTPIAVVSIDPPDGAVGVGVNQAVQVTFSDALASFDGIAVRKNGLAIGVSTTPSADGKTLTLAAAWGSESDIEITVPTTVMDIFGRHPSAVFTSHFRTADVAAPRVSTIEPANDAIQVAANGVLTITFDEPLAASIDPQTLVTLTGVSGASGAIAGTAAITAPNLVTFTPAAPLADNARYTVLVNGAIDRSGNQQTQAFSSTFATTDTVAPALTLGYPSPNGIWLTDKRPLIDVLTADQTSGVDMASRVLRLDGAAVATQDLTVAFRYAPAADLAEGPHTIDAQLADRAGNVGTLAATFGVDLTPPSAAQLTGVTNGQVLQGTITLGATATDAASGIARIDVLVDGVVRLTLVPSTFQVLYDSKLLPDGPHTLTARAVDLAGNVGPLGTPVDVTVDNNTLNVTISAPAAQSRYRDSVTVSASASEVVSRIEFSVGEVIVSDTSSPYSATLSLTTIPDGTTYVNATAYGSNNNITTARVAIVVDHTPPAAPDASVINAEPPAQGYSLVYGRQAAVESKATVDITNQATGAHVTVAAAVDGSFTASIAGVVGQSLSIIAIDDVGNRSAATIITVRSTPSLPASQGTTSLRFEGVLADRVGTGRQLTGDGQNDAVFTVSVATGDGVTRQLSYIDLVGPQTRSTRLGVPAVLGVAVDPGANFLNGADGHVTLPVTSGATLTLFAADAGFIVSGATYTVTVAFTDGSRFVADTTIVAPEDKPQIPRSMLITANPATVAIAAGQPGTATLTLTDIRDIDGVLVPDGAKVALTAINMGSKDPRGNAIASAGGAIADGAAAANNASFRVFTVSNGQVMATYQSDPVTPASIVGASAVVQVLPADAAGNVLGTEAIATFNLNLRVSTDRALVIVDAGSIYADGADRRTTVTILVRDVNGQPLPAGTNVLVSVADCASAAPGNLCVSSSGGTIIGGTQGQYAAYRVITLDSSGRATFEYSASNLRVGPTGVAIARIQVLTAGPNGSIASNFALGTGDLVLVGMAGAELSVAPDSLPLVLPFHTTQVRVRDVRDGRANRVPDGAQLLLSVADCASGYPNNTCVSSAGGLIVDGSPSTYAAYRLFPLSGGEASAIYSTNGMLGAPGEVKTAMVQLLMGMNTGAYGWNTEVALTPIRLLAPLNAAGTTTQSALLADGALRTATVTFFPVLDADGNVLPDGTTVTATVADCGAAYANNSCVPSAGGQILDGSSTSYAAYRSFTVTGGAVTVTYGDQNLYVGPGGQATANVVLLEAGSNGNPVSYRALGIVPISLVGTTSATATVSPTVIHADGADRRASVTITDIKDTLGRIVPDGTVIVVAVSDCAFAYPNNTCVSSAGGRIIGGTAVSGSATQRWFTVQNGQVAFEYSADAVTPVASGERIATVQIVSGRSSDSALSNVVIATAAIRLLGPSTVTVSTSPQNLTANGSPQSAQIVISNLVDSGGVPIPDGSKIALTVADCAAVYSNSTCISSVGGQLSAAGTTPGDGAVANGNSAYRIFTVAGGQVQAVYSSSTIAAQVNETRIARLAVAPASYDGHVLSVFAIGVADINLRGTTSTVASGPATLVRGATASVTFSGIKDAAGNVVPDGTVVLATAGTCFLVAPGTSNCYGSSGGTITDGTAAGSYKAFTVMNGSVTLTYSSAGAGTGTANVQLAPALPNNTIIGNATLVGGVWSITITP
jgi:hypothetical protein